MLLLLLTIFVTIKSMELIKALINKRKTLELLKSVNSKEDLLYMKYRDFIAVVTEVLKRSGYSVKRTSKCGIDGSGLLLNKKHFAEVWKHGLHYKVDVELAMSLEKCMRSNSIYRGMLITLGDFKTSTKYYCHKNVIECVNGDRLLSMCKAVQNPNIVLQPAE